ncbi:MAG TPA: hypothetical protein VN086_02805 [Candidatus Paceibacterota bacterium]|nr:hypothetical protein [Candidatus Paceibacterota bacterium]
MRLTDQDIQEFIEAYEADFGETITPAEAREMGTRVLDVMRLLATDPNGGTTAPTPGALLDSHSPDPAP